MPLIPLWAAHMNSMSEALLSFHSPSKLFRMNIFSKALTFWSVPPLLGWVLVAAELEGDLEVVGGEIVEVLHPTTHWVPEAIYLDCVKRKNSEMKKDENLKIKITNHAEKEKSANHAAPLVIPPCFANSFSSESQPGVRGFDILKSKKVKTWGNSVCFFVLFNQQYPFICQHCFDTIPSYGFSSFFTLLNAYCWGLQHCVKVKTNSTFDHDCQCGVDHSHS